MGKPRESEPPDSDSAAKAICPLLCHLAVLVGLKCAGGLWDKAEAGS